VRAGPGGAPYLGARSPSSVFSGKLPPCHSVQAAERSAVSLLRVPAPNRDAFVSCVLFCCPFLGEIATSSLGRFSDLNNVPGGHSSTAQGRAPCRYERWFCRLLVQLGTGSGSKTTQERNRGICPLLISWPNTQARHCPPPPPRWLSLSLQRSVGPGIIMRCRECPGEE